MKTSLCLLLPVVVLLNACRLFCQADFFTENYTQWNFVQQVPADFTPEDLEALGIAYELRFTDPKTGQRVYVFRRHHTPYYTGVPSQQLAEVWRFDAKTNKAVGIYLYYYNKNL